MLISPKYAMLPIDQLQNADGRKNHWKRKALESYIVSNDITPK